ncbi:MAG: ATP phosphoribosyltransferase regulatory subunit [Roseiflexus sp.]|nr:ATP phosphoribosyltransferase regulatory subunit [Roseiflexus sp.]MCS7288132.1 ATP phosphoribosyltransferase regulatory subunit [Roseiflexus sp.]MDW8147213.1 ATP phosphoribosyltransferase regulatory subunit [Roseiflexaceae bacterium]MDW8233078.1 ATP phosphoribosyltransferase regulatory subunit [Roseiflexaceae bacterium]
MGSSIDAVRGMRDVLPSEVRVQAATAAAIERVLAAYGYEPVDLPIIEHRDLYLRKLGEELVGKVYEFHFNGRDLALRPEWTASVLRAYVGRMQDHPLPLRLRYAGPVFRNERPQRATYRQFTQIGVELIGGTAPRADAECLALACEGLVAAGVTRFTVRIGHIGLIRSLLAALGLSERTQGRLVWRLERLREQGAAAVRAELDAPATALPLDPTLLDGIDDQRAEALLLHALREIGVNLRFGTRPPEAIVGRLVRKLRRSESSEQIDQALQILDRLCRIEGRPDEALATAEEMLRRFAVTGLEELRAILHLAAAHGVALDQVRLDFGLGRGLHYYTGMIFEIYAEDGLQLCGGGRYDDLVSALGGRQPTPAVGFAYGLERVVAAASPAAVPSAPPVVMVVATDDASYPYALETARVLRGRGYTAITDVRMRGVSSNLRDAARRGVRFVVVVGADERAQRCVTWRDLVRHEEHRIPLNDIPLAEI